jgi:hypothetical protein
LEQTPLEEVGGTIGNDAVMPCELDMRWVGTFLCRSWAKPIYMEVKITYSDVFDMLGTLDLWRSFHRRCHGRLGMVVVVVLPQYLVYASWTTYRDMTVVGGSIATGGCDFDIDDGQAISVVSEGEKMDKGAWRDRGDNFLGACNGDVALVCKTALGPAPLY